MANEDDAPKKGFAKAPTGEPRTERGLGYEDSEAASMQLQTSEEAGELQQDDPEAGTVPAISRSLPLILIALGGLFAVLTIIGLMLLLL